MIPCNKGGRRTARRARAEVEGRRENDSRRGLVGYKGRPLRYDEHAFRALPVRADEVKQFTAGGTGRFAEFVDRLFDRSHLSFSPTGQIRFVRCSFRGARLVDFRVNPVDLIDCDSTGANTSRSIFWVGPTDYDLRQRTHLERCNEIHGNDFSGATLVDISFRRGVDLTLQRLPVDNDEE